MSSALGCELPATRFRLLGRWQRPASSAELSLGDNCSAEPLPSSSPLPSGSLESPTPRINPFEFSFYTTTESLVGTMAQRGARGPLGGRKESTETLSFFSLRPRRLELSAIPSYMRDSRRLLGGDGAHSGGRSKRKPLLTSHSASLGGAVAGVLLGVLLSGGGMLLVWSDGKP